MRLQRRAPQSEGKDGNAGSQWSASSMPPAPSPTPVPGQSQGSQAGKGKNTTSSKTPGSDDLDSSNNSSPDSISDLLSNLPLPQKATINNGTASGLGKDGKAAIPRPTTLLVPPPPRRPASASHPSQLMGAFLGSFFVLLLGTSIIYTWRLRTRRKRKEIKDHKAWLKVQMGTPGSEAAFRPPPSIVAAASRSTYSKSISAYSKSIYSCSDGSTHMGSDLSSNKSISNLYTVPPGSWSDLSAQARFDHRQAALGRIAYEASMSGPAGILVRPTQDGMDAQEMLSLAALSARYPAVAAYGPLHSRRSSVTARLDLLPSSSSSLSSAGRAPFDSSLTPIPRPAAFRPSTHSTKSRWSLSESFDDIDEAAMWLPSKSSDPPAEEEKKVEQGPAQRNTTEGGAGGSSAGDSRGSSTATTVEEVKVAGEKKTSGAASEEQQHQRLAKELEELEASCGRISTEALSRAQQQQLQLLRHPPTRPLRKQRPPHRLSVVSESGELASAVGVPVRSPSRLSSDAPAS